MRIILFFLLIFACFGANATLLCKSVLYTPKQNIDIDAKIEELAILKIRLEQAKAKGESSIALTALKKESASIQNLLIQFLTPEQFKTLFKRAIFKLQNGFEENQAQIEKERDKEKRSFEIEMDSRNIDGTKAVFNRVTGGSFKMGNDAVDVTLSKDFEMMATVTTQVVWKKIAELANTLVVDKRYFGLLKAKKQKYKINLEPSQFKGETLPVEKVSYNEVQEWIKALNELSAMDAPELYQIIVGHRKGAKYRLPSEAEWEFVLRIRGSSQNILNGDSLNELPDYAWVVANSSDRTHPVAQKLPWVVEGHAFYDMLGNVIQFMSDGFRRELPGGIDPVATVNETRPTYVGCGFDYDLSTAAWSQKEIPLPRFSIDATVKYGNYGFRLIREI